MTDRDRLIELQKQATTLYLDYLDETDQKGLIDTEDRAKYISDYLLANGVIVTPCDLITRLQAENERKKAEINCQKAEIEKLSELVDKMSDYFPACLDCKGKTEQGVRTEKCAFLMEEKNYCAKRGIKNIAAIQTENETLKAEIERLNAERGNEHRCYLHISEDLKQSVNRNITAKSEAVKEFAEKLIAISHPYYNAQIVFELQIKNLLKEMVGEE